MNSFLPMKVTIERIVMETNSPGLHVNTYTLRVQTKGSFSFVPGQFVEISLPGEGEAPFGVASVLNDGMFDVTIKRAGRLTAALHTLSEGDSVFLRGPFGRGFPLEELHGKSLLFVAGGLGLAPLRPLLQYVIENRNSFDNVSMLVAAKAPDELLYTYEYELYRQNARLMLTVDKAAPGWTGSCGFAHEVLEKMELDETARVLVCGPPPMISAVKTVLLARKIPPEHAYTSLEMRMSCGVGKCGHCNIGHQYVCVDGPVFRFDALQKLPGEF